MLTATALCRILFRCGVSGCRREWRRRRLVRKAPVLVTFLSPSLGGDTTQTRLRIPPPAMVRTGVLAHEGVSWSSSRAATAGRRGLAARDEPRRRVERSAESAAASASRRSRSRTRSSARANIIASRSSAGLAKSGSDERGCSGCAGGGGGGGEGGGATSVRLFLFFFLPLCFFVERLSPPDLDRR